VGERNTLLQLVDNLKTILAEYDPAIAEVEVVHGPERSGDIPHSLASIEKAKRLLGYEPTHRLEEGLRESIKYYLIVNY